VIQVVCPHLALFGSALSYEHLRVFGCTCYPNTTTTAPHKISPRSTRYVFLGYSADHKGYCCLDLSTNRLIASRHVIFDEDSFPLIASPSLIDLDFHCESGLTVSTIGTHLTTVGTSNLATRRPAPVFPLGFEPPCGSPICPDSSSRIPAPGGYHGCTTRDPSGAFGYATCHHRQPTTPYIADLTGCLRLAGGGSWSCGDTWCPLELP
jgi:hypothetical protein